VADFATTRMLENNPVLMGEVMAAQDGLTSLKKKSPKLTRRGNWLSLDKVKPRKTVWLWNGRVPLKNVANWAGDPGQGKSLMTNDLIARGSRGIDFLDGSVNSLGVFESILLNSEDDPETIIVPRLLAAQADLSRVHIIETVQYFDGDGRLTDERLLQLDSDLSLIMEKLRENRNIKLVVIDPISNYLGGANLNREQEIRTAVLRPISRMAQEFDVAVILVSHYSKQQGRSAQHKVIGAVGVVGACRMAWSFVKSPQDPENVCEMLLAKENLGKFSGLRYTTESVDVEIDGEKTTQARVKFLGTSEASIETILASAEDQEERRERPAIEFIKSNLPRNGEHASKPLIKKAGASGISEYKLLRARETLGVLTTKRRDGWYWQWPLESTV
jgi:putative DNA primase/helicase